jgi:hypothetical protein
MSPLILDGDCQEQWNTEELQRDFEVLGFSAPFVVVKRKSDGKKGSLQFQHSPRIYFHWQEHRRPETDKDFQERPYLSDGSIGACGGPGLSDL